MKCQHCLTQEANFHYRSSINGEVREQHLCADCAQSFEGSLFANTLTRPMEAFGSFFQSPLLGGSLFSGGFPAMGPAFAPIPQRSESLGQRILADTSGPREAIIPSEADDLLKQRRQRNCLQQEMQRAVEQENFERAAELRDEIHRSERM